MSGGKRGVGQSGAARWSEPVAVGVPRGCAAALHPVALPRSRTSRRGRGGRAQVGACIPTVYRAKAERESTCSRRVCTHGNRRAVPVLSSRVASVRGCGGRAHGPQRASEGREWGSDSLVRDPRGQPGGKRRSPVPRACRSAAVDPLGSVPPGSSVSAPDGAVAVPGCVEEERVWAVGRGCLGVVSPQLLICSVWLLRRQALLTSRGTASSAADRRSPGECRAGAGPRAGGAQPSAAQRPGSAGPHRILREACRRGTGARREILAGGFGVLFLITGWLFYFS